MLLSIDSDSIFCLQVWRRDNRTPPTVACFFFAVYSSHRQSFGADELLLLLRLQLVIAIFLSSLLAIRARPLDGGVAALALYHNYRGCPFVCFSCRLQLQYGCHCGWILK